MISCGSILGRSASATVSSSLACYGVFFLIRRGRRGAAGFAFHILIRKGKGKKNLIKRNLPDRVVLVEVLFLRGRGVGGWRNAHAGSFVLLVAFFVGGLCLVVRVPGVGYVSIFHAGEGLWSRGIVLRVGSLRPFRWFLSYGWHAFVGARKGVLEYYRMAFLEYVSRGRMCVLGFCVLAGFFGWVGFRMGDF